MKIVNPIRFAVATTIMVGLIIGAMIGLFRVWDRHIDNVFAQVEAVGEVRAFNCDIERTNSGEILLDDGNNWYSVEGEFTEGTPVTVYIADNGTPECVCDDIVVGVYPR